MYEGVDFKTDLEQAETALQEAEEAHGPDHIAVSHCLDRVAKLLRSKGIRTLDAANMEARARAIRIKNNAAERERLTPEQDALLMTIKLAAKRRDADRARRAILGFGFALVCVVLLGKLLLAPSPGERQALESVANGIKNVLPNGALQDLMDQTQTALKDTQAATKQHSEQVDQLLQDGK